MGAGAVQRLRLQVARSVLAAMKHADNDHFTLHDLIENVMRFVALDPYTAESDRSGEASGCLAIPANVASRPQR